MRKRSPFEIPTALADITFQQIRLLSSAIYLLIFSSVGRFKGLNASRSQPPEPARFSSTFPSPPPQPESGKNAPSAPLIQTTQFKISVLPGRPTYNAHQYGYRRAKLGTSKQQEPDVHYLSLATLRHSPSPTPLRRLLLLNSFPVTTVGNPQAAATRRPRPAPPSISTTQLFPTSIPHRFT